MNQVKRLFIGRTKNCDIALADESISRRHAELTVLQDGSLFLTDCNSTNGTFLIRNGKQQPVAQELISAADVLQFGDIRMPVSDILKIAKISLAPVVSRPAPEPPDPGDSIMRCECGAVKVRGKTCRECGK